MSRELKELQEKGHPANAFVLKVMTPQRREHINRLGDCLLDHECPFRRSIQLWISHLNPPLRP
jgi:hypothetical protein